MRRDRVTIRDKDHQADFNEGRQLASMACLVLRSLRGTGQNSNHKATTQRVAPQILQHLHQCLLHFEMTKKREWFPWATMLSCLHREARMGTGDHSCLSLLCIQFGLPFKNMTCTNSVTLTSYSPTGRGRETSLLFLAWMGPHQIREL